MAYANPIKWYVLRDGIVDDQPATLFFLAITIVHLEELGILNGPHQWLSSRRSVVVHHITTVPIGDGPASTALCGTLDLCTHNARPLGVGNEHVYPQVPGRPRHWRSYSRRFVNIRCQMNLEAL